MSPRSALLATPVAAALLVALTACGAPAAAPATAASAGAAKPGTTAAATTSAAASAAPTGPVDACTLVPVATVAKIMDLAYVKATPGSDASECGYDTSGVSLAHLTLMVQVTGGKDTANDDLQVIAFEDEKPIPLTGLGDSAYEAPEGSDVRIEKAFGALWGDTYVTVGGPVRITEAQARQLLTAAHDAL